MKTKAYKLAAELGLAEAVVLDWLRSNGYPRVQRKDTIRADVVLRARKALRGVRKAPLPSAPAGGNEAPPRAKRAKPSEVKPSEGRRPPKPSRPKSPQKQGRPRRGDGRASRSVGKPPVKDTPLVASFAELLEAHLPANASVGEVARPQVQPLATPAPVKPAPPIKPAHAAKPLLPAEPAEPAPRAQPAPAPAPVNGQGQETMTGLRLRIVQLDKAYNAAQRERDELRALLVAARAEAEAARAELLSLKLVRAESKRIRDEADALRAENERLRLERTTLRQDVRRVDDERATLASTCAELQEEVREAREVAERQEQELAQRGVMEDLESTMQREMAWRARALELERAVQAGGNLPSLLKTLGLAELRQQTLVLQALLEQRETALPLMRAIRQVEARTIERLVAGQIQRTCAHPICNQVTKQKGQIILRVDRDDDCEVCAGDATRRWFARMVQECERAGIRRLLVIGGMDVHVELRRLSQGEPVDLRLVTDEEEPLDARIQGRVEGCDLLVVWSPRVASEEVTTRYARHAHSEERMVVRILGDRPDIVAFTRAVTHRLARGHILLAT